MTATSAAPPRAVDLPDGFRLRLRSSLRVVRGGEVIVGGTPLRVLRLHPRAAATIQRGEVVVSDSISRAVADRLLSTDVAIPVLDQLNVDADELTVVIPVRDRVGSLDKLLALLRPALRCIVVDDASIHRAPIAQVCRRHGAELLRLDFNLGPAAARNAGLARVASRFVAFVDSDVSVAAADLVALTGHFADPRLAAVAPRVRNHGGQSKARWFQRFDAERGSLDLGQTPSLVRAGAAVSYLPSACLVAVVDRLVTGFDPALRVAEDVDLVWRLDEAGWRVRYAPETVAEHASRDTIRSWLGRIYLYGTGGALLAQRHDSRVAPAVLSPAYLVAAASLTAQRRWSVPVAAAAVGYTAIRVNATLDHVPGRAVVATRLAVRGLGWALIQESSLLLRHWWPLTAVGLCRSQRIRRATVAALVVDVARRDHEHQLPWAQYLLARRLEDLAYGAGLWAGAFRAHSVVALAPCMVGTSPTKISIIGRLRRRMQWKEVQSDHRSAEGVRAG